jgi:hypothetical protein
MQMHGSAAPKAVHNMALVGGRRVFLSHLPMFMAPHDAQVLLEATFVKDGKTVDDLYFADHASHSSERFYTVRPEAFAIQELFQAQPSHPLRSQFKADVFRGHLEKGGAIIESLTNIEVHIKRLVHGHRFDADDEGATLTYVMFGGEQELFLAHLISKAPDFDQILSVSITGEAPSVEALQRGITVECPERRNVPSGRLKAKETIAGRAHVTGTPQVLNLTLVIGQELYFEEGELSSTQMSGTLFNQTAEERKAGFE